MTEAVKTIPTVTTQQLINAGLNAFGLQLFIESIANKGDAKEFQPLSFVFRGIRVTMQPETGQEIDTSHH